MEKKNIRKILLLLLMMTVLLCACSNENTEETSDAVIITPEKIEQEEVSGEDENQVQEESKEEKEPVTVNIYSGNKDADALVVEAIEIPELAPMELIKQLGIYNIVSLDTTVTSFSVEEEAEETIIYLDLSKEFEDYIGMMGTSGEYIVLAGLTNTFLDAYKADKLMLTAVGTTLETGHAVYDDFLTMYPLEQSEEAQYKITDVLYEEGDIAIHYPQIGGMKDEKVQTDWNYKLKEYAMLEDIEKAGFVSYELDYEIATQDAELISIIFRGGFYTDGGTYPYKFKTTFNLDLRYGDNMRLKDYADVGDIVTRIESGTGYNVLQDGPSKEEVNEYLTSLYVDDYALLFLDYDYDFRNQALLPTGYSYIKDGKPVLVMEVPHAMGDFIELEIDCIVR